MRILVTGGGGFIGSHTVERLLRDQFAVRVMDNFSSGRPENLPRHAALEVQIGDIRCIEDVERAMRGVTHVIHLAAQVSVQESIDRPVNSCSHNVRGFVNVIEAARRAGVQRMVYASSAAVYGDPQELPLRETSPAKPLSPYGLEKMINDQYAGMYRDLYGLSCLGLRYFNVYGARQDPSSPYAGVISKFIESIQAGKALTVFGDGRQTRDFVYVGDIAEANHRALLGSAAQGVVNVATGSSVTLLDVIDALSQCVARTLEVRHMPPRTGDIVRSATHIDRLREMLAYNPATTLREGLRSLLEHAPALAAS